MPVVGLVRELVLVASLAVGGPTPAPSHHVVVVHDPAHDGQKGRHWDIVRVRLSNGARAVDVDIDFVASSAQGDIGVGIEARNGDGVGVLAVRGVGGSVRAKLVARGGRRSCPGLTVTLSDHPATAHVRVPATCLHQGRYNAVRARVIAEIGSDADYAPKGPPDPSSGSGTGPTWTWTPWVDRAR